MSLLSPASAARAVRCRPSTRARSATLRCSFSHTPPRPSAARARATGSPARVAELVGARVRAAGVGQPSAHQQRVGPLEHHLEVVGWRPALHQLDRRLEQGGQPVRSRSLVPGPVAAWRHSATARRASSSERPAAASVRWARRATPPGRSSPDATPSARTWASIASLVVSTPSAALRTRSWVNDQRSSPSSTSPAYDARSSASTTSGGSPPTIATTSASAPSTPRIAARATTSRCSGESAPSERSITWSSARHPSVVARPATARLNSKGLPPVSRASAGARP